MFGFALFEFTCADLVGNLAYVIERFSMLTEHFCFNKIMHFLVELYVGSRMFLVILKVMDIHPSYNVLLGRPWIHAAGAVASSLH